jgi:hypothetical protein
MAKKVVDPFMAEKVVDPFMAKQVVDPFTTPTSANYARMLQASSAQIKSNLSRSKGGKRRTRKQRFSRSQHMKRAKKSIYLI